MPQVKVNLFATLRQYVDGKPGVELEITSGETIGQALGRLGVPPEKVRVVFVDNQAAGMDRTLVGGEELGVFPAIGGG